MWSCARYIPTRLCRGVQGVSLTMLFLCSVSTAWGVNPRVSRMEPYGGKIGTEVEVKFFGDRLEDAAEVLSSEPGLTITNFVVTPDKGGKEATAKIAISADTLPGVRRLRLRTLSGISDIVNFFVGPYDIANEKEPNTDFTTPQEITSNLTIHGRIDNEDVDHFVIDMKQGERLSVEVEGLRLGHVANENFLDPYLAVLNESRFELAAQDDHALTRQDAFISLVIPEDGKYIIQLRDASYGGNGNAYYRLHVGNFARPTGVLPAGGRHGETVAVKFLGDPLGEFEQAVVFPQGIPLTFGAFTEQGGLRTPTMNPLWVSPLDNVIEAEPNNTLEQATPMSIPSAANGVLTSPDDLDYFKITLKKDQEVDIDVIARRARSSIDSVLDVFNAKGGRLAGDDDRKRPDSWLRFKAPEDGDFYLKVRDQLGNAGPDYFYRIEVTRPQPFMEITVNDVTLYVQPDIVVPQGSRKAVLANVRRENFGGPVQFTGQGLPAGVTLESPADWAGDGTVPLMFHAPADAPLTAAYATVEGTWQHPSNPEIKVTAPVQQRYWRIRARNNQPFWMESFDKLAVTVTEKVPFDVQVVIPKVPLVRGGSLDLKVIATKEEGFDEDIQLLVLQNPAGVNSSRSIKISKGQTEAVIPFNASGNAPLKESLITVRAISRVGNGTVEICTPYFPMTVVEKYMNLKYLSVAVDQGGEVELPIEIENLTPFEGTASVELIGLPTKTSTTPLEITKETTQISFPIKTEADAPLGETKNLFCKIVVMQEGEPVLHNIGTGRLRINKPSPVVTPKPAAPVQEVKKEEQPKPKVLSRLEMLRQQQEELRKQMNN